MFNRRKARCRMKTDQENASRRSWVMFGCGDQSAYAKASDYSRDLASGARVLDR